MLKRGGTNFGLTSVAGLFSVHSCGTNIQIRIFALILTPCDAHDTGRLEAFNQYAAPFLLLCDPGTGPAPH